MKKHKFLITFFAIIILVVFVTKSHADAESSNWTIAKRITLDHLTLGTNAERSSKALKIITNTPTKEQHYENTYGLTLKYLISPIGVWNAFTDNSIKPDTNQGYIRAMFLDNINFYIQGTLGNKFNSDDVGSLTLKTTNEASYKFGVSFNWCLGTALNKCNSY